MRALVTGWMGFVGRHFAAELESRGWEVYGCDVALGTDVLDAFRHERQIHYDLVVHAAARSPHRAAIDGDPAATVHNQHLDAAMFDWALRTGQHHVLYLSSCAANDAEPDDYGLLKLTGERMAAQARRAGLGVTVVRPYSGYGSDQSELFPFGAFVARAKRREDPFVIWGGGQQVRDWIHVDDVVAGALAAVESDTEEPVSLCTGIGTSMLELVEMVCGEAGYRPTFVRRFDQPAGVLIRVGDPARMREFYTPTVDLVTGVKRAFAE